MGEIMKKIIKRVICFFLSIAITIVSFGSVVYASEEEPLYKSMYQVKYTYRGTVADEVKNTPYNLNTNPNNFTVESKDVLGNEKHYLTWDNEGLNNSEGYKIEIYCIPYMEYRKIEEDKNHPLTETELENIPWSEYPFIPIHCVDVDAVDCGTVVNFSDIQETLKKDNIFTHDPQNDPDDEYADLLEFYSFLESKFNLHYFTDKLNDYNRVYYYMSYIPDYMKYLRFGRVKYFARYVSKSSVSQEVKPDEDGYYHYYINWIQYKNQGTRMNSDGNQEYIVNPVEYKKELVSEYPLMIMNLGLYEDYRVLVYDNDYVYKMQLYRSWRFRIETIRGDNFCFPGTNSPELFVATDTLECEVKGKTSKMENYVNFPDTYTISNYEKWNNSDVKIDTNIPIFDRAHSNKEDYNNYVKTTDLYKSFQTYLSDGIYFSKVVKVGKFVENDTQITVKPTPTETPSATPEETKGPDVTEKPVGESTTAPAATPTSSPTSTSASLPSSSIKPNGTGNDYTDVDNNDNSDMSDIVHWLKMIYNRCGKMLEQIKIINTVVDKLNEIIANQKKAMNSYTNESDYNDVVKYLKKIYHLLYVNSMIDDLTDSIDDYIEDIGDGVIDAATSACDVASNTFPFSIVFVPKLVLDALSADPKTPYKEVTIKVEEKKVGEIEFPGFDFSFTVDLSEFDDVASMFREMSIIIFLCGMVKHTVDVVALMKDGAS